jgi:exodeoxyribonuclease VII small subunit
MANKQLDYKALQAELDDIMQSLQHDDIDIDMATKSYERGMEIITQLEAYLETAENKVQKLRVQFGDT